MNRDHAAELIPAFVVDALEPDDRLLVEGLLSIDPGAAARRDRLEALINRAVFYDLVELGTEEEVNGVTRFGVWSGGVFFPFADASDVNAT